MSDQTDAEFLTDLAGRLFRHATPAMGFDQGDTDRLYRIAAASAPLPAEEMLGLLRDARMFVELVKLRARREGDAEQETEAADCLTRIDRARTLIAKVEAGGDGRLYDCSADHCQGYGPWRVLARHADCAWIVHGSGDRATYRSVDWSDLTPAASPQSEGM